jgi:hypothetical protein
MIGDTDISSLAEAVVEVECRFKCIHLGHDLRMGPVGEMGIPLQTTELCIGLGVESYGPKGLNIPAVYCVSEKAAAEIWLRLFLEMGRGFSTVYWRIPPDLSEEITYLGVSHNKPDPLMLYRIYSRQVFT